ncbi:MAG: (deoxy)nucleoside triphosphate pyrophosphohydrolase [Verrucomicrobiaceae bacterium]
MAEASEKVTEVVCAVIIPDGRALACQRPPDKAEGGKWEFPGGKVESGEDFAAALRREIEEELGLVIMVEEPLPPVEHNTIRLRPYRCQIIGGQLTLHEHLEARWVNSSEASSLDWADADLPILKTLELLG